MAQQDLNFLNLIKASTPFTPYPFNTEQTFIRHVGVASEPGTAHVCGRLCHHAGEPPHRPQHRELLTEVFASKTLQGAQEPTWHPVSECGSLTDSGTQPGSRAQQEECTSREQRRPLLMAPNPLWSQTHPQSLFYTYRVNPKSTEM